jgi:hypothetical protein
MNRIASGLCVAAAFSFAASLGAQTSTSSATGSTMSRDKEVTVTGCLQRGADGNYTLTNAMLDTAERSGMSTTGTSTTGTTGSTAGTTTAGSTAAGGSTMGSSASSTAASSWILEGGTDLDKHVGHKVQVTGRELESSKKDDTSTGSTTSGTTSTGSTATTGTTGTSGSEMSGHRSGAAAGQKLDVRSVKMIASSCS